MYPFPAHESTPLHRPERCEVSRLAPYSLPNVRHVIGMILHTLLESQSDCLESVLEPSGVSLLFSSPKPPHFVGGARQGHVYSVTIGPRADLLVGPDFGFFQPPSPRLSDIDRYCVKPLSLSMTLYGKACVGDTATARSRFCEPSRESPMGSNAVVEL